MIAVDATKDFVFAAPESKALVLAGPGTGKTEAVARRLEWLVCGEPSMSPRGILVLAFSRSAVQVLTSRLRERQATDPESLEELRYLSIRTFDSWAFRLLRLNGDDPKRLIKRSYEENIRGASRLLRDFPPLSKLGLDKVRHIIVDECQDLTGPRAALVRDLLSLLSPSSSSRCGFTILGDPEQAIYDWNSSQDGEDTLSSEQLTSWIERIYGDSLLLPILDRNHRAESAIIELTNTTREILLDSRQSATEKLVAIEKVILGRLREATINRTPTQGSLGILCRTNGEALSLTESARVLDERVAVLKLESNSRRSFAPAWIGKILGRYQGADLTKTLFDQLAALTCGQDEVPDSDRCWKMLTRACAVGDAAKSISMAVLRKHLAWQDSLPDDEWTDGSESTVTTIHQSKGREFDTVLVTVPSGYKRNDCDPLQEARLLYVGMTRAKSDLQAVEVPGDPLQRWKKTYKDRVERQRWMIREDAELRLEVGIDGDFDQNSFVSSSVLGDAANVEHVQALFRENTTVLFNRPVELRLSFQQGSRNVHYDIHVDHNGKWIKVGQATSQLSLDINAIKHPKKAFPKVITGLFVNGVVTYSRANGPDQDCAGSYRKSGIWLGLALHGVARMRPTWRGSK